MPAINLDAYFRRIQWKGAATPTFDTLAGLLRAHTSYVPFENLDALLGLPIRLDLDSIQAKIVGAGRGGYCYEHATLFAAVLEALGFQVTRHAARVVLFHPITEAPRSHMFLSVSIEGVTYIVDSGFGPFASPFPVPLTDGATTRTHWTPATETYGHCMSRATARPWRDGSRRWSRNSRSTSRSPTTTSPRTHNRCSGTSSCSVALCHGAA